LITLADEGEIANFKLQMKELCNMNDLGLLSYNLGIEVQQNEEFLRCIKRLMQTKCLKDVV
jgi:hypothetical protein